MNAYLAKELAERMFPFVQKSAVQITDIPAFPHRFVLTEATIEDVADTVLVDWDNINDFCVETIAKGDKAMATRFIEFLSKLVEHRKTAIIQRSVVQNKLKDMEIGVDKQGNIVVYRK
jgi:hypothetical protein